MRKFRKPITCCYNLGSVDFGGGAAATSFKGPLGKRGRLIDIGVRVTETFACDTTTAKVRLGTATDADAYAELIIPDGTAATDFFNTVNDDDAIIGADIPENTQIEVTIVDSDDTGTAAGIGEVFVVVDWY